MLLVVEVEGGARYWLGHALLPKPPYPPKRCRVVGYLYPLVYHGASIGVWFAVFVPRLAGCLPVVVFQYGGRCSGRCGVVVRRLVHAFGFSCG